MKLSLLLLVTIFNVQINIFYSLNNDANSHFEIENEQIRADEDSTIEPSTNIFTDVTSTEGPDLLSATSISSQNSESSESKTNMVSITEPTTLLDNSTWNNSSTDRDSDKKNLPLILGLSLGLGIPAVIVISGGIIYLCLFKKAKSKVIPQDKVNETSHPNNPSRNNIPLKETENKKKSTDETQADI